MISIYKNKKFIAVNRSVPNITNIPVARTHVSNFYPVKLFNYYQSVPSGGLDTRKHAFRTRKLDQFYDPWYIPGRDYSLTTYETRFFRLNHRSVHRSHQRILICSVATFSKPLKPGAPCYCTNFYSYRAYITLWLVIIEITFHSSVRTITSVNSTPVKLNWQYRRRERSQSRAATVDRQKRYWNSRLIPPSAR